MSRFAPTFSAAFAPSFLAPIKPAWQGPCLHEVRAAYIQAGLEKAEQEESRWARIHSEHTERAWSEIEDLAAELHATTEEIIKAATVLFSQDAEDDPIVLVVSNWQECMKDERKAGYLSAEDYVDMPESIRYPECGCPACQAREAAERAENEKRWGKRWNGPRYVPGDEPTAWEAMGEQNADW